MNIIDKFNTNFEYAIKYIVKKKIRTYFLFFIIVTLLYLKTLWYNYTFLDDVDLILQNHGFLSDWSNLLDIFRNGVFLKESDFFYRPLLTLSFMIDEKISGINPWGYHLSNMIYHYFVVILLFNFLKHFFNINKALIFTLLFSVHPVFAQAVAWIPGRNDELLAIGVLLLFLNNFNYKDKKFIVNISIYAILSFTILLLKETAVVVFIVLFLYEIFMQKFARKKLVITQFILTILITAVWFIMRQNALIEVENSIPKIMSFKNIIALYVQYIGNLIFPLNLAVYHIVDFYPVKFGLFSVLIFSLLVIIFCKIDNIKRMIFGFAWFVLMIAPTLFSFVNLEHRLYIASIGIIILLGSFSIKRELQKFASILFVYIFIIFSLILSVRMNDFKNGDFFWNNALKFAPESKRINRDLAAYYYQTGRYQEAKEFYLSYLAKLTSTEEKFPILLRINHINILQKKYDVAEKNFIELLKYYENEPELYLNYALMKLQMNAFSEAEKLLEKGLSYNENHLNLLKAISKMYYYNKNLIKAEYYLSKYNTLAEKKIELEELESMNIFIK